MGKPGARAAGLGATSASKPTLGSRLDLQRRIQEGRRASVSCSIINQATMLARRFHRRRPRFATLAVVSGALLLLALTFAAGVQARIYWDTFVSIGRANLDGTGVDRSFITGRTGE